MASHFLSSRRVIVLGRSCLFIYLFVHVVSKLFFKIFHTLQFWFDSFHNQTGIIPRRPRIWLVIGVAKWRFLAIWRPSTVLTKNGLAYSGKTNQLWRHNGFVFNTQLLSRSRCVRYNELRSQSANQLSGLEFRNIS